MATATKSSTGRQVVVYDDFSGGEYGSLGDWNAPRDSFTGLNVVRYVDGSIGPRCGLVDLAPASVPTGTLCGFGFTNVPNKELWFAKGNTVYGIPGAGGGTATAYTTTFGITPTTVVPEAVDAGGIGYVTVLGSTCYKLDHSARTVTALASTPGGTCIAIYGDRLVVANGGGGANPFNRLYYSAAADFTSFPAANYIDIGDTWGITGLYPQRQNLAIAKQDGSWYVLAGVPGVNEVVRQVSRTSSPRNPADGTLTSDGLIWYVPPYKDVPAVFNGSSVREIEHLSWAGGNYSEEDLPPSFRAVAGKWAGDMAYFAGITDTGADNRMAQFREKVWSFHTFDVNTSAWAITGPLGSSTYYFVSDGGGASTAAKFYAFKMSANRPPLTSATLESLGDASTTPFSATIALPEWWAKDGQEIKVRAVVVDFKKFNHGASADNAFTISVTPRRLHEAGDGSAETESWSEATASASTSGTRDRFTGTFESVFGNGFQLSLTGLVGVAIQKVWVYLDPMPARGF